MLSPKVPPGPPGFTKRNLTKSGFSRMLKLVPLTRYIYIYIRFLGSWVPGLLTSVDDSSADGAIPLANSKAPRGRH